MGKFDVQKITEGNREKTNEAEDSKRKETKKEIEITSSSTSSQPPSRKRAATDVGAQSKGTVSQPIPVPIPVPKPVVSKVPIQTTTTTTPSKGRPRLLSATFDVERATAIGADLMKMHPTKDFSSLSAEYEAWVEKAKACGPLPLGLLGTFICGARSNSMMLSSCFENFTLLTKLHPATDANERAARHKLGHALGAARVLEEGASPFSFSAAQLTEYVLCATNVEEQAFLYLLLATGQRPSSIYHVPLMAWAFEETLVGVNWRLQKAQRKRSERHDAEYLFEWSMRPPQAVVDFLGSNDQQNWATWIPKPDQVATTVNWWMRRLCRDNESLQEMNGATSSAFRDAMDQLLRSKGVTTEKLKLLLDHSSKTSDAHYSKFAYSKKNETPKKAVETSRKSETPTKAVETSKKSATPDV